MNDHLKNSTLCGHLLVFWAMGLNASGSLRGFAFSWPELIGVAAAALALLVAHVFSGLLGAASNKYLHTNGREWNPPDWRWAHLATAATAVSWLCVFIGAF